jgi:hypothetical protein
MLGRERLLRAGNLANVAAYGWYTLTGALLLELFAPTGAAAVGWLLIVGVVQLLVNWAIGPAIYGTLWLGHPLRALVEMLRDALPAGILMAGLGGITVVAFGSFGLAALGLFALVAVLPQSALTFVARTRPVARLDPLTAARRYAAAMAVHLGLDRDERRELDAVVRIAHARDISGDPGEHLSHAVLDWSEASCAAGHVTEWWNGAGGPAGLPGGLIPQSARIAAVARTWASLTADGSPRIGHMDALSHLDAAAGVRLDPRVVKAAFAVVSQERISSPRPSRACITCTCRRGCAGCSPAADRHPFATVEGCRSSTSLRRRRCPRTWRASGCGAGRCRSWRCSSSSGSSYGSRPGSARCATGWARLARSGWRSRWCSSFSRASPTS